MAITETSREKQTIQKLKDGIRICEEAIKKAEKYERLQDNLDWKGFWDDAELVIQKHQRDIEFGISMLPDAPSHPYVKVDETGKQSVVSSRSDWADFITHHEIQKTQLEGWKKEPIRIIALANMAREKLPLFRDQLASAEKELDGTPVES